MANRLAREQSPYLQQHQDNPVDWWPWGEDAFAHARSVDKPIFLSIGYSTCHWCHVMAHESFEDVSVAAVLNRDFVPVKLDREERPDVDRVYMTFVQATTGAGGWPMSVWLTPDLHPFFGGTYFPVTSQHGRPGFVDVLAEIARSWRDERQRVLTSASTFVDRLREATGSGGAGDSAPVAGRDAVDAGVASFTEAFDPRHGGFGGAPKFPRPSELQLLFHAHALTGSAEARRMALESLRAMALGGIRDHVGGGFHRYSVDAEWRVPHFEKMLYDQSQLVLAYLDAGQVSGDTFFTGVAEDTLRYVLRDLTNDDGAFCSAEDADSPVAGSTDSREGAFYVWTGEEVDQLFGERAAVVRRRFGIEDGGNAPADPHGEFGGQNILYVAQDIEDIATRTSASVDEVMDVLVNARATLFESRAARPRPHRDDKVVTAWNGLMIAAFARAARVLTDSPKRAEWRAAAERAARVVRSRLWSEEEQRLLRRYRGGEAAIDAFCEDYACLVWGLTELFEATGDRTWLGWASELTTIQTERFFDERDGGWFATAGDDPSVLLRLKEDYDGAEPAAASVTVRNLLVLGRLLTDPDLVSRAGRTLERYGPGIARVGRVMPFMLSNVARWHSQGPEIVVVGPPDADETAALERVVARHYLPWAVTIPVAPGAPQASRMTLAHLDAMGMRDGRPTAYVCRDFTCQEPVTDAAALGVQLSDAAGPNRIVTR